MPPEQPTVGQTPENVQHQLSEPKEHLSDTAESLSGQVMGMAHNVKVSVDGVIQGAKETAHMVQEAVDHAATDITAYAKNALDVRHHIRKYPRVAVGCAIALGFTCGRFFQHR
jgi:hypothetical protein